MIIGGDEGLMEEGLHIYFRNIPASMFTAFRCFTGECVGEKGQPLPHMLALRYGVAFVFTYVVCYMLVTMGIFNVILAVYVDITMRAAKETDAANAEQHARESIRVARCARELVKKFAAAYREYDDGKDKSLGVLSSMELSNVQGFSPGVTGVYAEDDALEQTEISKDLFLVIIQDHYVQELMDELDLPPDRANLFEVAVQQNLTPTASK